MTVKDLTKKIHRVPDNPHEKRPMGIKPAKMLSRSLPFRDRLSNILLSYKI